MNWYWVKTITRCWFFLLRCPLCIIHIYFHNNSDCFGLPHFVIPSGLFYVRDELYEPSGTANDNGQVAVSGVPDFYFLSFFRKVRMLIFQIIGKWQGAALPPRQIILIWEEAVVRELQNALHWCCGARVLLVNL